MENWRQYLKENKNKIYYWQTNGPWKSEGAIQFGTTHVPKAKPRESANGLIEKIFEEVRKKNFPSRPSRLDCVFLCDSLGGYSGGSYCSHPPRGGGETYEIELRGDYNAFKTNTEYWTEAVIQYQRNEDADGVYGWAESYWEGGGYVTFGEILVNPPEAAIIMRKYEKIPDPKQKLHDFKEKAGKYLEELMGDWFYDDVYGWDGIDPDKLSEEEFMEQIEEFFVSMHANIDDIEDVK
jgi:hypothetical protein